MSYKEFALKDVLPNPYRDLTRFPEKMEKIEALKASYAATGYWENIEGREIKGKLEIAYGHNRLRALLAMYKPTDKFNFIVRELSESDMILRMSHENDAVYAADISGVCETIRAVVMALAEGNIPRGNAPGQMPEVVSDTPLKHVCQAPSFIPGAPSPKFGERWYTAGSLAVYLGRTKKGIEADESVLASLRLLRLEEMKVPGWTSANDSELNKLRNADGAIPADRALRIAGEVLKQHRERLESEAKKAEIVKQASLTAKQYSDALKKEEEERKTAQKIVDLRYAEERKQAREEEAKCRADKKIQDEKNEKEKAARLKEAERLYERDKDEIAKSSRALKLIEEQRKKKEEIARVGFEKTMREGFARYLSEEDPYVEMQKRGKKSRTDKERQLLKEVLEKIHDRVDFQLKAIQPDIKENK